MAAPSYATDLTDITTSFTTNWNLITEGGGGQNALTAPETDDFIQGTEAVSRNPFSSSIRGIAYDRAAITVASGDAVFYWWKADVAQALDTLANGGVHLVMGSSLTAYKKFYVAGNDTYQLGGWRCNPIDPTNAGDLDRGTPGSPNYDTFGVAFDVPASGPSKGYPFKIDMIRHGRQVEITAGDSGDPATWDKLTTYTDATTRRWGIVQGTNTGASMQGIVRWGTTATAVYSRDSNRAIVFVDTLSHVPNDFTQLEFNNASTDLIWDGMSIISLDTLNRGLIAVNNNASVEITNSVIQDINTTADGGTNSTWDGTKWINCNAVTSNGGSFLGCQILTSTVAADAGAFVYNLAADPDGELDGMSFSKGTNDHHAIEFGTSAPTSMTLRDITFTGFSGSNNVNGSVLNFLRTTGTTTVTLVGTTTPSYKVTGTHTVEFVTNPVTATVTTIATTGSAVGSCRVFVYATSTTGSLPAQDSVTIVNSGTTATVTHTGHGLSTNDKVWINGASLEANNGVFQITVTGTNAYTYTMGSSPGSSPTGSITSTFVFINGVSNATTGIISLTRSISANQSISGWARKSSSADNPKYKTAPIAGTVDSTTGASFSAVMIPDE